MKRSGEQENKKEKNEQQLTGATSNNNDEAKNAPEIIQLVEIAERQKRRELYLGLFTETKQLN